MTIGRPLNSPENSFEQSLGQTAVETKLEVETIKCTLWGVSIDGAHVRIFDLRRGDESLAITICGIPAPTPVTTGLLQRCGQQSGQE
jgi:hypothetical protein